MKRKDQYEHSAIFFVLAVVGILIVLTFLLITNANAQPKTAYLIVAQTTQPEKTTVYKVTDCAVADSIVVMHFGNSIAGFSTSEALKSSPYYLHERRNFSLYIEKKRVVYSRSGKMKFRKWKR